MVRSLVGLIGSKTVPLNIRNMIAFNINFILKNMTFKKIFNEFPLEAHTTLKPVYSILIDSCK